MGRARRIWAAASTGAFRPSFSLHVGPAIDSSDAAGPARHPQNLAFHKNAFGLVMVPMEMPDGVSFKARETQDGCSIRVVKDYDIDTDEDIIRLDILYGVVTLYPELACRIFGAEV